MSDPKDVKTDKPAPPPMTGLIATASNDITIPHYSKVLRPIDETLLHRGGGKGIALYREVLKDGRAYTVLQKRKRKLVAREWVMEPASTARVDRKAAQICEEQFRTLNPDRITLGLLDATLMGFAVSETEWERDGFQIRAKSVVSHDQRRFLFGGDRSLKLLTWDQLAWGIDLPDRKFIVHRFEDLSSDPYGWGLGRILFWHVLFKREGVAFWMKALERFATPLPVGKYPIGSLPEQQAVLLQALAGSMVDGALVVPAGTDVAFATAAVSGTLTHESWCRYWDEQTAETVLGQTLSTNIGSVGSKAAAESHKDTEDALIDGDADLLGATLRETLLAWITLYNAPDAQPPTLKWKRPVNVKDDAESQKARADAQAADLANLRTMRTMGWAPADEKEYLAEVTGIEIVAVTPPPAPPPLDPNAPPNDGAQAAFAASDDDLERDVDLLEEHAQPVLEQWLDRVRQTIGDLIDRGGTLADLPDELLRLYPQLPVKKLGTLLSAACLNSELRGMADVNDEAGDD